MSAFRHNGHVIVASFSISRLVSKRTALEDNGLWLIHLHDLGHHWLEERLVCLVRHPVLQRHIHRIFPPPAMV